MPSDVEPTATETVVLFFAGGPADLAWLEENPWRALPRDGQGKPLFCPVSDEGHAARLARQPDAAASEVGYVLRFEVPTAFWARYPAHRMRRGSHEEFWIPWADLDEVDDHLVGPVVVAGEHRKTTAQPRGDGGQQLLALGRPKVRPGGGPGRSGFPL